MLPKLSSDDYQFEYYNRDDNVLEIVVTYSGNKKPNPVKKSFFLAGFGKDKDYSGVVNHMNSLTDSLLWDYVKK